MRQKLQPFVGVSMLALLLVVGCSGGTDGGSDDWEFGAEDSADAVSSSGECVVDSDCPGDEVCSALDECLVNCTEPPDPCRDSEICIEVPSGKKGCAPSDDHGADEEEDEEQDDETDEEDEREDDEDEEEECFSDTDCAGDEVCSADRVCVVNCVESENACKDTEVCQEVPSGKKGCVPDGF